MERIKEAKLSTRLMWALAVTGVVIITLIGLLMLYHDVANDEKDVPTSVYQPVPTDAAENVSDYSGEKLDLNLATKEALRGLPGVGETLAQRIIDYRTETPFKVVRDLKKVPGIGEKKYEAICDYVFVTEPQ